MNTPTRQVRPEALRSWAQDVLHAAGLGYEDALAVASNLVEAECRGVRSHGLLLLPMYVDRVRQGGIRSDYRVKVVAEQGGMLVLDAGAGPGQAVMEIACAEAVARASRLGIAAVQVMNNNHVGMLATYARILAEAGLASLVMTTAGPSVFAFGGAEPALGNNGFCYGAPSNEGPLLFDMATAVVACGKIRYQDLLGEALPEGWAADRDGLPSTSSRVLDEGGGVLPLGHKGFGFACMVDLFAGLMAGGRVGMDVGRQRERPSEATGCSQQIIAMRPTSPEAFEEALASYVRRLRGLRPADAAVRILAPGDPERLSAERVASHGIELAAPLLERLHRLGEAVDCAIAPLLTPIDH